MTSWGPWPRGATSPFAVGARVASQRWGEGTVYRYDGDHLTVLFDEHNYRDLLLPLVLERGLLRPVASAGSAPPPDEPRFGPGGSTTGRSG